MSIGSGNSRKGRTGLIVVFALVAVLLMPACVGASLYWSTSYGLARANVDGSEFDQQFIAAGLTGPVAESFACEDVVTDASHIYWSEPDRGSIARANLDGSEVEYDFITGLDNPCGIAADATSIYWTEFNGGTIARANLDAGQLDRDFISGIAQPCGIAVGGGYIYWTAEHSLTRLALSGGIPHRLYEDKASNGFCGVTTDAAHVYWGGFGESIGRAGLDGSHLEPSFITGIERPCGIAVLGSRIYWTRNIPPGAVQGTDLEGSHAVDMIVGQTGGDPCGIAADSLQVTPAPPPPPVLSHVISFWHSRHGAHSPVTFIRIKFPQAGSFTIQMRSALKWRVLSPAAAALTLSGPEERLLKIEPGAGSQSATALRAKLRRSGRAQIAVSIHFSAQDGTASMKRKWLLLVDRRQHRKSPPQ
jgi:virginiamycin B lyase